MKTSRHIRELKKKIRFAPWKGEKHVQAVCRNIAAFLDSVPVADLKHRHALPGQAFDSFYLKYSSLYRFSRELFLKQKGVFESRLCTSPRSLSSSILLENRIQYSPTQDELFWRVTDPRAKKESSEISRLLGYSTSLFHEQSHRILWKLLPPPSDLSSDGLRRYLNFIESLVVGIDMVLGDELGPELSALGYQTGVLYDPGTYAEFKNRREMRNYYHAAIRSTYLLLEGYHKDDIPDFVVQFHPELASEVRDHAIARALRLDDLFVELTNPEWQKKNQNTVRSHFKKIRKKSAPSLDIPEDKMRWEAPYLAIESVFQTFKI